MVDEGTEYDYKYQNIYEVMSLFEKIPKEQQVDMLFLVLSNIT